VTGVQTCALPIWCLLPVIKASNLDGFNERPFSRCQLVTASEQVVNGRMLLYHCPCSKVLCNRVSSACWWYKRPRLDISEPIGVVILGSHHTRGIGMQLIGGASLQQCTLHGIEKSRTYTTWAQFMQQYTIGLALGGVQ